jgi:hypothetical protein
MTRLGLLAALKETSAQSLQRRFFVNGYANFPNGSALSSWNPIFKHHVALVVCTEDAGSCTIVRGGRYVVFERRGAETEAVL